ncbi:MAG TPA: guanylate kinase [Bacillota bacterium]
MTLPGLLIVLSAPSGAGKGAVRAALQKRMPELRYGVSVTTRPPRPGERDGTDYRFVDEASFHQLVAAGALVEWACVYDHYYGTPREPMESWLEQGIDVIVEKDIQGAKTLMERYPDAVFIFILPPSLEELRRRMLRRGTESPAARNQRLRSAREELTAVDDYDYCVVNENVDEAARCVQAIITAEKCRVERYRKHNHRFWLKEFELNGGTT